ncbi:MAG: 2'-5' RNA ligase family protein [Deltaproteobacteria bacterium]|nr:2'-5' RNA ligase family protein [Deltaproteobacteria bacterium]
MSESAFIVRVPEAEACVAKLRQRFDPSVALGVPAHITVLAPFMEPNLISQEVLSQLRAALGTVKSFQFQLGTVARFPATAYLAPEPAEAFVALTELLVRHFPHFPPFRGAHPTIVPHLTVANGNASEAEAAASELEAVLGAHGPIAAKCSSVVLLENSTGLWKELHAFPLRNQDG